MTEKKKIHPLTKARQKQELETKVMKIDGFDLKFRELTGAECDKLLKFTDNAKSGFYLWDTCINSVESGEWVLMEPEFMELRKNNRKLLSMILDEVFRFNALDEEAKAILEEI